VKVSIENQRQRKAYFENLQQFISRAKTRIDGFDLF
jgi:hypothetical protein